VKIDGGRFGAFRGLGISLIVHGAFAVVLFFLPQSPAEQPKPIYLSLREIPPKEKPAAPPEIEKEIEIKPDIGQKEITVVKPKQVRKKKRRKKPPLTVKKHLPSPKVAVNSEKRVFGLPAMELTTSGVVSNGVKVPLGNNIDLSPQEKGRVNKNGFKEDYEEGEDAPLAVITTMPRVIRRIVAEYPEEVKEIGIEGQVILLLSVDSRGRVVASKIVKKLHPKLDKSARQAAFKMRFTPAYVRKIAVSIEIQYTFVFVLD